MMITAANLMSAGFGLAFAATGIIDRARDLSVPPFY